MEGYTQANTKKKEVAKKMIQGLTMHGSGGKGKLAMKYKEHGDKPVHKGGMKPKMHGVDEGYAKGEKPKQSNPKASFSRNYTENAK